MKPNCLDLNLPIDSDNHIASYCGIFNNELPFLIISIL